MSYTTETAQPLNVLRKKYRLVSDWNDIQIASAPGGFSGARVFKVENANARYSLRRWPVGSTFPARLFAIHQLLALAQGCGVVVVPVPLKSDTATTLPEIDGQFWQLEPWMPGVADFRSASNDDHLSDARLKSAMTQLARFYDAVRNWIPPTQIGQWFQPAGVRPSPTVKQRIRMIESYVGTIVDFEMALTKESNIRFRDAGSQIVTLFRTAHLKVKRELAAVAELSVPQQPCIRDLWHDHLLFQDDNLSGIVDFGAMATDSVSCDLSRLLGSLFGDEFAAWERGLSHYEAVRPMTEAEHRLLRPLDRSSVLLSGMTWLKRRYVLGNTPDDLSRVCDRLDTILARLTTLALDT